jgi:hypothetical protein
MVYVVEMAHKSFGDPDWRAFNMSGALWERVLDLGKAFGWTPHGTIPDLAEGSWWVEHPQTLKKFEPDYEPDSWLYAKQMIATDAGALADALENALEALREHRVMLFPQHHPVLLGDGMTEDEFLEANSDLSDEVLTRFVAFLRAGQITFAWDD